MVWEWVNEIFLVNLVVDIIIVGDLNCFYD